MVPRKPHLWWILVANLTIGFVSPQILNETCVWSSVKDSNTEDTVLGLSQDFLEFKQRFNPIKASIRGFHEFDDKLPPFEEACYLDMRKACNTFIQRTDTVLKGDVSNLDIIYLTTIKWECRVFQEGVDLKTYVLSNIGHFEGVQSHVVNLLNNKEHLYDFSNVTDLEKPLIRLQSLPKLMDDIKKLLEQGIKLNMTISSHNMPKIKSQFQAIQNQLPESSSLYRAFKRLPNDFGEDPVRLIQERAKSFIGNQLMPAYQALENFLTMEYASHARETAGIFSFPNGRNIYQKCLEFHTSIDGITADEIHQIGLEEVAELKKSVLDVMKQLKVNLTFQEFTSYVRDTPGQTFQTPEELLDYFKSILIDVINPKLPQIFPKEFLSEQVQKPSVLPSPPGYGGLAYFISGSVDGKRAGSISINLENLKALKKFELMALMMHEGNPGHNMYSAFKTESPALPHLAYPLFGRHATAPANFPFYSALSEGWGLYSEYLGLELGLYEDPYDLIGFYSWNLLRAARLVVDTGLHHYGWTSEKAVEYIVENTFLSRHWAEGQVSRYIDWPGQATAYKMGERYIKKMRQKYEEMFADQLSLPEFHRRIMICQVPLDKLEQCLGVLDEMNGDPVVSALHNSSFNILPVISVMIVSLFTAALMKTHVRQQ